MKKYISFLPAFLIALAFTSCDYVANPNETLSGGSTVDTSGLDSNLVHRRRVLVEDYTGHKCPNCPQAAIVAQQLINTYGDSVVVIGVHAGFFANPTTPLGAPAGSYLTDFRTSAGTTYDSPTYFGISNAGNPNGMINRRYYTPTTTNHIIYHTSWNAEVASLLALPPVADLSVHTTYNASTRTVSISTVSQFISDTLVSGSYNLVVLMTQDSIVEWQQDGSTHIPNYVHRHVLRTAISPMWGDVLTTGTVNPHALLGKTYSYTLPTAFLGNNCDEEHCHIVAFIYNTANYEVIQAAEAKVTP
ncbi:MAG: outer membrane protein Omp28 [Bacteroidetes bacterium]|nr:outer membrane protein Omp28 [Bacteroidota bacterium]